MNKKRKAGSFYFSRRKFIRNGGLAATGFMFAPDGILSANRLFSPDRISAIADTDVIRDKLRACSRAQMKGPVGRKLELSYTNRVFAQQAGELVEPFRHRNETHLWQTEFWGKWFTSAVLAYRYRPDPVMKKVLDDTVRDLISTQTPDGYIGNYKKENRLEQWDIWGRKYCLLGLLAHYDLTKDTNSLQASVKLTDHLIREINDKDGIIVNKGNYRGMAASSVLEPIVHLYRVTRNKRYLAFAEEIVRQWETPEGPRLISKADVSVSKRFPKPKTWYSYEQGQKAYEMMSCYEGLLELYRVTGKEMYKKAVELTWNNIREEEINIAGSGASVEMWFGGRTKQALPVEHFQETCVTVTWIKLCQQLFRLTGEAKYADAIEQSYYNALMSALNRDGSEWAKYTPLNGQRLPGSGQCGMKLNCCNANGPRGQFTLPFTAVMAMDGGISVNFYVAGSYQSETPSGKKITIIQKTDYPASGDIEINMLTDVPEEMALRFRIPEWSRETRLELNGNARADAVPGAFVEIKKLWSSKDRVSLQLDMRGRVAMRGAGHPFAAILRGPLVLARDSTFPGTDLGIVVRPVKDKNGNIPLTAAERPGEDFRLVYHAPFLPESYTETGPLQIAVPLCDYASAGNGKTNTGFQVWMPQLYDPREH
jgi:DUF1680 family protein